MSTPLGFGPVVIQLDLRSGAAELDTAPALRARVARQLGRAGLPEPDDPLFLVTDTPAGLTDHQRQYELLTAYRAVGDVRILVLLVGSAPGSYAGQDEAYRPDRRLLRPAVLRTDRTAILWAGDLRSARTALEQPAPDDPDALAVLVDVLSVPDVYLRVLSDLEALPDAVAAPGVRLLEQDLPPEVRDRAWRDALTRFAGHDTELAPSAAVASGADLPDPLRALVAGRGGRDQQHRQPGGPADDTYRACADALDYAVEALAGLRTLPGLLRPTRRTVFEADLDEARRALDTYRDLVGRALRAGTGSTAETAAQLTDLGLRVPTAEGMRDRIGEGLREYAEKLLTQGLPLRSVAQRFTGLAGRVEPVPGSALLPRLAATMNPAAESAPKGARGTARQAPTDPQVQDNPSRTALITGFVATTAGLLGALWQGPLLALALTVPLLFVTMAHLGATRLRDAGRPGRWAVAPRIAAGAGAAAGAITAYATNPPLWLSTAALLTALCMATETARHLWRTAADTWAPAHTTAKLRRTLHGLDALLAEGVQEHWAVEERLNCADAARSVAGVLRATAAAAEAEAVPESERPTADAGDWLSSTPDAFPSSEDQATTGTDEKDGNEDWMSAYAWPDTPPWDDASDHTDPTDATRSAVTAVSGEQSIPRWLDRETGEGGPELVSTLAGDLADAALKAMTDYWGAVERGQTGTGAARRIEGRVAELLSTARRHLRHNGVLAPPPFASPRRTRAASANLLGTDPHGLAGLVGADADRQAVVQLSSPDQGALLSRDPAAAVWIRFAPLAVRDEVEKAWRTSGAGRPEEEVAWTSSGRYAGLLRLTPLRPGVVDTFRPRQDGDGNDYGHRNGNGQTNEHTSTQTDTQMNGHGYEYEVPYDRGDGDRW